MHLDMAPRVACDLKALVWCTAQDLEAGKRKKNLTVDVISAEQTSQTYLTPPSPPLAAVFFLMTPMVAPPGGQDAHPSGDIDYRMGEGRRSADRT
jgi:hypothetical protein